MTHLDTELTYYTCVAGTHSWAEIPFRRLGREKLWWQPGSKFTDYLATCELALWQPEFPFQWDTQLSGAIFFWKAHTNWQAAGAHLVDRLSPIPLESRNVIAHSHGLQVVMYACAYGLEIRNLVTVGGPVRGDMREASEIARKRIAYWLAISDPNDKTQRRGEWFDNLDWQHMETGHPLADMNARVPHIGHSQVLYDPALIPLWTQQHWTDALKMVSR